MIICCDLVVLFSKSSGCIEALLEWLGRGWGVDLLSFSISKFIPCSNISYFNGDESLHLIPSVSQMLLLD